MPPPSHSLFHAKKCCRNFNVIPDVKESFPSPCSATALAVASASAKDFLLEDNSFVVLRDRVSGRLRNTKALSLEDRSFVTIRGRLCGHTDSHRKDSTESQPAIRRNLLHDATRLRKQTTCIRQETGVSHSAGYSSREGKAERGEERSEKIPPPKNACPAG